ncbi:pleckstrin homology domain-containing family M member 3 [Trichonephila clavata]|uniref:Pleckstrin homology domain-containing family M member 3 n=1 Tax=Trichonephila clavata TaxID=2740835 RepID=A0A8X6KZV8_TRICU|nr:pleckstrin homology domain-containing family M member 3 [Trichonephila clavata]
MTTPGIKKDSSLEAEPSYLDFVLVPKFLVAEQADEETKKLMTTVGKICLEKDLRSQDFQCNSCGCAIGIIYGKFRSCHYDGYNYCYGCHGNDTECIPARMIHNWDFKKYPVSNRVKVFISHIENDPLLDISKLNPALYALEEVREIRLLRTQLTYLRSYIVICKTFAVEDFRRKLWPREYLYEQVHLYSITDMQEISSGVLAKTLQEAIAFARKHVRSCQHCRRNGFVCEMCKSLKPVYPFDVESTCNCDKCFTVFRTVFLNTNTVCHNCIKSIRVSNRWTHLHSVK